jgi:hypothetical protein
MNGQRWVYLGVAVVVLVGVFAVFNLYYVKPTILNSFAPMPVRIITQAETGSQNRHINQVSDDRIISFSAEETSSGDDLRNPFMWPGEGVEKIVEIVEEIQPVRVRVPHLGMILIGSDGPVASLDCVQVHQGEHYLEHLVEEIGRNHVVLSGEYGRLQLTTSPVSYGAPQVEVLESASVMATVEPYFDEAAKDKSGRPVCPERMVISPSTGAGG